MPRRPSLEAVFTMGQWNVSIPPKMTATGKRERRFFGEDQRAAEKFAAQLREKYHTGKRGLLTAAETALAADAIKLLAPLGINLMEAASIVVRQHEAQGNFETFRDRWLRYQHQHEMNWRPVYADQVARMPNWLGPEFMDSKVGSLTPSVIYETLLRRSKSKSTIRLRTRMVNAVISERGKERKAEKIEILSFTECRKLLHATAGDRESLRVVALLLFAGIRPGADAGEIMKLEWEDFSDGQIYIRSDTAKTGADRHIPITPRLARYLKGAPREGLVAPAGWKRRWTRIRKAAGISERSDICRHTFGSHFLAVFGEDATKRAMGHTQGSDTLFRHYRKAVLPEEGRVYFRLEDKP